MAKLFRDSGERVRHLELPGYPKIADVLVAFTKDMHSPSHFAELWIPRLRDQQILPPD